MVDIIEHKFLLEEIWSLMSVEENKNGGLMSVLKTRMFNVSFKLTLKRKD